MGRKQSNHGRNIHGVLLLDKPLGMTSNKALQQVKRMYNVRKAGHTGSLDPLASGLLPVCFGEATKFSSYLIDSDKRYETECQLGITTATGDAEGDVISQLPVPELELTDIQSILGNFKGSITQTPPMFSAIKVDGQPLYKLARKGIEIERKDREITVSELNVLAFNGDKLRFSTLCSKGTYIRTLVEDIGKAIGCGAYVTALRRTQVGSFTLEKAISLSKISELRDEKQFEAMDNYILPMEEVLKDWPKIALSNDAAFYLRQGQPVLVPRAPTAGWVKLFENESDFVGIGEILEDGRIAPKRLVNVG